jgi:hypothetical protein
MRKLDYELLADLCGKHTVPLSFVVDLSIKLKKDNPAFDGAKFWARCIERRAKWRLDNEGKSTTRLCDDATISFVRNRHNGG